MSFQHMNRQSIHVVGVLFFGDTLNLVFDNHKNLVLQGLSAAQIDCPPNQRIFRLESKIETELISGVVSGTVDQWASVYLILSLPKLENPPC